MLKKYNLSLLILPLLIFSLGFVTLLSTSEALIKSHILNFVFGIVIYILLSNVDFSVYKFIWKYLYAFSLLLLVLTLIISEARSGSVRWLEIAGTSIQTSEIAKFALIISIAAFIEKNIDEINNLKNLLFSFLLLLPYIILVYIQPDLGTTIVLISVYLFILFYSGVKKIYFFIAMSIVGIFSTPIWHMLKDYQKRRILVFLNPQLDVLGSGYNVIQSLIAVGSGGLFGKGFGKSTQATLQFLPAYWTDFIFASFAEEWGFLGVFLLILFYTLLFISILIVVNNSRHLYAKLVGVGIFSVIFIQFLVNVGMNLGLMPVTGVTLPLMSYGGSSIILVMAMLGVLQNIWKKYIHDSLE